VKYHIAILSSGRWLRLTGWSEYTVRSTKETVVALQGSESDAFISIVVIRADGEEDKIA
jgi:hypothetical protein